MVRLTPSARIDATRLQPRNEDDAVVRAKRGLHVKKLLLS